MFIHTYIYIYHYIYIYICDYIYTVADRFSIPILFSGSNLKVFFAKLPKFSAFAGALPGVRGGALF